MAKTGFFQVLRKIGIFWENFNLKFPNAVA